MGKPTSPPTPNTTRVYQQPVLTAPKRHVFVGSVTKLYMRSSQQGCQAPPFTASPSALRRKDVPTEQMRGPSVHYLSISQTPSHKFPGLTQGHCYDDYFFTSIAQGQFFAIHGNGNSVPIHLAYAV